MPIILGIDPGLATIGFGVIKSDKDFDLAVLEILPNQKIPESAKPLNKFRRTPPITGEHVITVGSPLGYQDSVTLGIISNPIRNLSYNPDINFFQTDAATNPGNSGGPFVDMEGKLIGIHSREAATNSENINFVIRMDTVAKFLSKKNIWIPGLNAREINDKPGYGEC